MCAASPACLRCSLHGGAGEQPPNHLCPEPWVMRTENMVGGSSSSLEREWFQYCSPTQTSRGCFEGNLMPADVWASREDVACAVSRFYSRGPGKRKWWCYKGYWKQENSLLAVPFSMRKPIGVDIHNPNDECVEYIYHPKPTVSLISFWLLTLRAMIYHSISYLFNLKNDLMIVPASPLNNVRELLFSFIVLPR